MPTLFDPIKIGELELANRIIMAPLTRCRAEPGRVPGDLIVEYYTQRADAGLIISEATSVTPRKPFSFAVFCRYTPLVRHTRGETSMLRRIRNTFAAIAVASLLLAPASALAGTNIDNIGEKGSPPMVDVLLMRPLGLAMLVASVGLYLPAAALTALTRPSELDTTTELLVRVPARFVFSDPLGSH